MTEDITMKRLQALQEAVGTNPAGTDSWEEWSRIPLLDELQFTSQDVCAVTQMTPTQLHNWISRGWVTVLQSDPGRGRRRMFCGADVVVLEVAAARARYGLLQHPGWDFAIVKSRAGQLLRDIDAYPDDGFLAAPTPSGEFVFVPLKKLHEHEEVTDGIVIHTDMLIIRALERLLLVVDGETLPQKPFPRPEPDLSFLPWEEDEAGGKILPGLSAEETEFYVSVMNGDLLGLSPDEYAKADSRFQKVAANMWSTARAKKKAELDEGGSDGFWRPEVDKSPG